MNGIWTGQNKRKRGAAFATPCNFFTSYLFSTFTMGSEQLFYFNQFILVCTEPEFLGMLDTAYPVGIRMAHMEMIVMSAFFLVGMDMFFQNASVDNRLGIDSICTGFV